MLAALPAPVVLPAWLVLRAAHADGRAVPVAAAVAAPVVSAALVVQTRPAALALQGQHFGLKNPQCSHS